MIGIISAIITIVILGFTYNFIADKISSSEVMNVMGYNLLTYSNMLSMLFVVYIGMGIGIGAVGSAISMRKYLEV